MEYKKLTKKQKAKVRKERSIPLYILHENYDDFICECHGPSVKICGYDYYTADAHRSVDPIAYYEGFKNWLSSMVDQHVYFEFQGDYYFDEAVI